MKIKLLVILGVYLIFHLTIANASEGASLTGYDWQKYSTTSKGAFILGWGICGKSATDNMPILMGSADTQNY